jgi:hypothetical protein
MVSSSDPVASPSGSRSCRSGFRSELLDLGVLLVSPGGVTKTESSISTSAKSSPLLGETDGVGTFLLFSVVGKSITTNPGYFSSGRFLKGEGVKRLLFSQLGSLVKFKRF